MTDACQPPYFDSDGCFVTPACSGIDPVAAYIETKAILGWNAGANSIMQLDGDVHAVFGMPQGTVGVIVGFKGARSRQTIPDLVTHGMYFQSLAGVDMVQVIERGQPKTTLQPRSALDTFEIRRAFGKVTYWQSGTMIYESVQPSVGPVLVNACIYASGDDVPGGEG